MIAHRRRIRLGRLPGELERLLDDRLDPRLDLGEVGRLAIAIFLDQPLAEDVDRIALRPGVDLLLRAVGADDRVALVMADGAVGLGLDQGRPVAGAARARSPPSRPA